MIIKRKFGDHLNWQRILQRNYRQAYFDSSEYCGYVTLLNIVKVRQPFWTKHNPHEVCILDNGYTWLQHFPKNQHHSVTTIFDESGNIVQWYIDICLKNGVENNKPFMDDLFLDIILLPSGIVIEKDKDEIEEALSSGIISKDLYALAWKEFGKVLKQIKEREFVYVHLSHYHKAYLAAKVES